MESKRSIFKGKILNLDIEEHSLPDGKKAEFEIVRHPGGAVALPILPDGRFVFVRQFRPAIGDYVLELPAGKLDPGDTPESCIHRELQEEIGYRADSLSKLGEMQPSVGYCDELVHLYLAKDLVLVGVSPEPDEFIEVLFFEEREVQHMFDQRLIKDAKTLLALLLYFRG